MALGERHVPYELWVAPRGVRRRSPFGLVGAICWGLALLGLSGGGALSMKLFLLGAAALVLNLVVGGLRRQLDGARERAAHSARVEPRPCVVVRWFGDTHEADSRAQHPTNRR